MVKGDRGRAVRRFAAVAVAGPLFLAAIAVVIQLLALSDVPEQVAVHWGAEGPDQMGPSWIFPVLTGSLAAGFVILISLPIVISFARSATGEPPTNLQFVTATLWAVTGFFAVCLTAALYLQRGLGPLDPITGMGAWAGIAAGFGVLAAAAGFFAAPAHKSTGHPDTSADVERLDVGPGERLVWSRTVALKAGPRFGAVGHRDRLDRHCGISGRDDTYGMVGMGDRRGRGPGDRHSARAPTHPRHRECPGSPDSIRDWHHTAIR